MTHHLHMAVLNFSRISQYVKYPHMVVHHVAILDYCRTQLHCANNHFSSKSPWMYFEMCKNTSRIPLYMYLEHTNLKKAFNRQNVDQSVLFAYTDCIVKSISKFRC